MIDKLQQLNRTMSYLVDAISQTNSLLSGISGQLRNIESSAALTAYNTSCIAHNTEVANRYNFYY